MTSVFFANVAFETTEEYLRDTVFASVGKVHAFKLFRRQDGKSRGEGICEFETAEMAERCLEELKEAVVDGRPMLVKLNDGGRKTAQPDRPQQSGPVRSGPAQRRGQKTDQRGRPYARIPPVNSKIVFFHNFPFDYTEENIRTFFEDSGLVKNVTLYRNNKGGFRGMGLVEFEETESAREAVSLSCTELGGRTVLVALHGSDAPKKYAPAEKEGSRTRVRDKEMQSGPPLSATAEGTISNVYFFNVSYDCTEQAIHEFFEKCGPVRRVHLNRTPDGRSTGTGHAEFMYPEHIQKVHELHRAVLDGRQIVLSHKPKETRGKELFPPKSHRQPDEGESRVLYFHNVPFSATEESLMELFENHGEVEAMSLMRMANGKSRGQGWVRFASCEEANVALENLNEFELEGRHMGLKFHDVTVKAGDTQSAAVVSEDKVASNQQPLQQQQKRRLHIRNLSFETPASYVEKLFSEVGPCKVKLQMSKSGKSQGFGYVQFEREEIAEAARKMYDQALIDGRQVSVRWADSAAHARNTADKKETANNARLVFVNVPSETSEDFLRSIFAKYGRVDLKLARNRDGKSLGRGSVTFGTIDDAKTAQFELHGALVDGSEMEVNWEAGSKRSGTPQVAQPPKPQGHVPARRESENKSTSECMFPANGMTCFVRNLNPVTDEGSLRMVFGEIGACQVALNRMRDGRSRGEGWILFRSAVHANRAVRELHEEEIDGSRVCVYIHTG